MKKSLVKRFANIMLAGLFMATSVAGLLPSTAHAAITNPAPVAKVSFTFDDGYVSSLTQAAPTLKKYGYSGTNYVITSCVGMTTAPNTCKANTDATYMSWDQIAQLKATYGWEIGSHSVSHPYLASSDPIDQPEPITLAQASQELTQSKADLAAHGINATSFAPPYGDYNMQTLGEIAKSYGSMRGFQDTGYNAWPYNEYLVRDQHVEGTTTVATVKSYIDTAIANNQWLVLTFHDIKTNPSSNNLDYEYSTANLDAIAAYVKSKNIAVANVSDASVTGTANLLQNPSFNSGLTGWTTDMPANVTADAAGNGSYPDATNSIKLKAGTSNAHLFSPKVSVDSTNSYVLKTYLNVQSLMSGGVGYYIDEYDGLGNWISGQYKTSENSIFAENINMSYKPTSATVRSASLQIIVTANSNITAFVDNMQWLSLSDAVVPPSSGQISQVNNLANGKTFVSTVGESTLEPGHPLTNINDKNESTRWISLPQDNAVISVDLGASYALNKVSILWAGDTTKTYTIQTSADNVTWTAAATGTTNNTTVQLINHTVTTTGRYLRIVGGPRWNNTYGNSIWEIGIYGSIPSLVNGSFDGGITGGWTTDNATAFKADAANHGSSYSIVNSVAMTATTTTNAQLYSPKVAVISTRTYSLAAYVNAVTISGGEVGFYIDEYDATGKWISGQYKGGARSAGVNNVSFNYTPSSAAVATASLQVILVGNSGITGYIDDIRWH